MINAKFNATPKAADDLPLFVSSVQSTIPFNHAIVSDAVTY